MSKEFKKMNYGEPEEQIIQLSRKQIEQMAQMADHFKEVDDFQLRIVSTGGDRQTVHFTFDLDLTNIGK